MSPSQEPTLVRRARAHGDRIAILGPEGVFTYGDLLSASHHVADRLLTTVPGLPAPVGELAPRGVRDLTEARIAYLIPPGFEHVAVQWGIWRAGGVAVPLAISHPTPELAYVLDDAEPAAVVVHPSLAERVVTLAKQRGLPVLDSGELCATVVSNDAAEATHARPDGSDPLEVSENRRALMIYTSGTTGRPKGVVTTHANVNAQVGSLVRAWAWSERDHILLVLPLHHVHGIVNVVTCALWSGACCQILPRFDATETWERFARGDITLFMAVPTVFVRLLRAWDEADPEDRERWSEGARKMRLMVSGSAALPISVLERWREVTGQVLLERYGMTEIGMGLSNPLRGERRPGHVGQPLPAVEIRRVDDEGVMVSDPGVPGELEVRGPGVFSEYWRRPEETAQAFRDDWFRTGDLAVEEDGYYRLLGRLSVDIIKTSGYKVSALQVEETLREHRDIEDCAVVGVPDPELGERLCGAVVPVDKTALDVQALLAWARDRLAPYKVPGDLKIVEQLPRNSMGKVQKQDLKTLFASGDSR